MKEAKQNSGSPSPPSPSVPSLTKKTTVQREFYVCFCAKNYNSYSALYLHAKKKHEQSLSMKCLKHTRHEWSGNVKNIYYEFVEENMDDEEEEQEEEESLVFQTKNKSRRDLPKNTKINGNENYLPSNLSTPIQNKKRLQQVFRRYLSEHKKQKSPVPHQQKQEIITQFHKFLVDSYPTISQQEAYAPYCQQGSLDFVPHLMNLFYNTRSHLEKERKDRYVREMVGFADWLYTRQYTRYLTVENNGYCEKFFNEKVG